MRIYSIKRYQSFMFYQYTKFNFENYIQNKGD